MDVLSIHEGAIIELSRVQRECWTKLYGEPEMALTLDAIDLYSKWGFGDGDIEQIADVEFTDEQCEKICDYYPLENLVRRYLVPEIERVTGKPFEVEEIETHHNPMRVKGFPKPIPEIMETISVTVTIDQIMECCQPNPYEGK